MDKAMEMGKRSAVGSLHLLVGTISSRVILAVGMIFVARILGQDNYGLYNKVLVLSLLLSLFRDFGIVSSNERSSSALTKFISQYNAGKKPENIRKIVVAGLTFGLMVSAVLSILLLVFSRSFALIVLQSSETQIPLETIIKLVSLTSIVIVSEFMLLISQSIFIGLERMEFNSANMIFQSATKVVLTLLLVFWGYGVFGAVLGHTLSSLAAGLLGLAMLYFILKSKTGIHSTSQLNIVKSLKNMLRYGLPLFVSSIIGGLSMQFYSLLMVIYIGDTMVGNYGIAANFSVLITFFTIPITTVLFPAFSKLDSKREPELIKTVFESSVKYAGLLVVPAATVVAVLSKPMVYTLYGDAFSFAPLFLSLSTIGFLFVGLGSLSVGGLLSGLGKTKLVMKIGLVTLLIGLPASVVLIPILGVPGIILISIVAGNFPIIFWGLHLVRKHFGAEINVRSSFKIFVASGLSGAITYLSIAFLGTVEWIRLLAGLAVFSIAYIVIAPLVGAVNIIDIRNLQTIFSGLGFVSRLVCIPLSIIEKMLAKKDRSGVLARSRKSHHD